MNTDQNEEMIMDYPTVLINTSTYELIPIRKYTVEEEKLFDLIFNIFVAEQWNNYFKAALNRIVI